MTTTITADQQITLTAVFKDANGGAVQPNLSDPHAPQPLWVEDSKGTIIVIVPSGDEFTCVVMGVSPGTATVTCKDRGTNQQATETIVVREGGVVQIAISAGTPERQKVPGPTEPEPGLPEPEPQFNPLLGGAAFGEPVIIKSDAANATAPDSPIVETPPTVT